MIFITSVTGTVPGKPGHLVTLLFGRSKIPSTSLLGLHSGLVSVKVRNNCLLGFRRSKNYSTRNHWSSWSLFSCSLVLSRGGFIFSSLVIIFVCSSDLFSKAKQPLDTLLVLILSLRVVKMLLYSELDDQGYFGHTIN